MPGGGQLRISSCLDGNDLRVRVINSGRLADGSTSTRIGMDNARQRLQLLYGPGASLELHNEGSDAVVAELRIPAQRGATA